jgi:hypothetical protein
MDMRARALTIAFLVAAVAMISPAAILAEAPSPDAARPGRWVGEWAVTIRVASSGRLAGEPVTATSETAVSGRLAAEVAPDRTVFEAPAARWSYRGFVSYLSAETTGAGELQGGAFVLVDGERLLPGATIHWRDERRVGSLRTVLRAASGEHTMTGPVDNGLEPIVFTVTDVTPTSIAGTIDAAALAKYEARLGEPQVEASGRFELRFAGQ